MTDSLTDLITDEALARLATPANLRHGREIVKAGGVVLQSADPRRVTALVTPPNGQRRRVELTADESGLHCRCT